MTQTTDPAQQFPMRDEVSALSEIAKASQVFSRDTEEIMEAAKLVQLRLLADKLKALDLIPAHLERISSDIARIADALDRLAPPVEPITSSNHNVPDDPLG